jgi:hypothetical protein
MWPSSDPASPQPPAGRAVPSLGPFAELLGQPYQRLKVAVLRQLAGLPEPSWSLAEAGPALTRLDEVDRYGQPGGPPAWRLSEEGHLVATVCAVLAAPATAPERTVKVLAAAMALARAAGVDERAAFAPFVAATAVLERDLAALHRLIDRGEDDALAAAGEVAAVHLADLGELARQVARPGGHEAERERAAAVAGRLQSLLEELAAAPEGALQPQPPVAGAPDREGSRPGARGDGVVHSPRPGMDAAGLREVVAATDPAVLAGLVAGRLRLPPAVARVRAGDALAALDEHLGRPEPVVVPLPEPTLLPVESPEVVPDFVLLAADVMTWLAGLGETDLARWVVGGTWAEATARMAAVVEAWSRWGPAGDGSLAAELDPRPRLEVVGHDEVGVISWTGVRAPGGGPAAEGPVGVDLDDEGRSTGGLGVSPADPPFTDGLGVSPSDPRREVAT